MKDSPLLTVILVAILGMSLVISTLAIREELWPEKFGCTVTRQTSKNVYEIRDFPDCVRTEDLVQ